MNAFLSTNIKLGAEASVAAGPVGAGAAAATRDAMNAAYYGGSVKPGDVLIRGSASKPDSAGLNQTLNRAAAQ